MEVFREVQHFSIVNRRGSAHYRDDWHRHHLIPRQCMYDVATRDFFALLHPAGFRFDDFTTNGMLLPATMRASETSDLPVHAGPHFAYNDQVAGAIRVIRARFRASPRNSHRVRVALSQIRFLQSQLRRAIGARTIAAPQLLDHLDLSFLSSMLVELDRAIEALVVATTGIAWQTALPRALAIG